jgi:glycosyltransferase involved in cell wall biosynthesis
MKIALVNYRYFISGGPERYLFNIKDILESEGHEVIPFSVKNKRNVPTEFEKYFLESIDDEVYFAHVKKNLKCILLSFCRMFYSFEAKKKFKELLIDTKPDLVYILQYHNKISPSFISVAKKRRIPVVHRISDFQYMCPNALFYNERNGICEDCLTGKKWNCVKYRCVANSSVYSFIKLAAQKYHALLGITKKIDAFVVPASFTLNKLRQYGVQGEKLHHIPTFFNLKKEPETIEYKPFFLYVGRISKEKGLMTLIKAFVDTSYQLKIIGFSSDDYEGYLKNYLQDKKHAIEFLGRMDFVNIVPYLSTCLCTVLPSEWYDNFPNSLLESFAYKKAVIATNIGSLPELVKNDETGLLFDYASVSSLKEKIKYFMDNSSEAKRMGENAYRTLIHNYSPQIHYARLIQLFKSLLISRYV